VPEVLPRAALAASMAVAVSAAAVAALLLLRTPHAEGGGAEERAPDADDASGAALPHHHHPPTLLTATHMMVGGLVAVAAMALRHVCNGWSAAVAGKGGSGVVPPQFICPITSEVMRDPVMTSDGHAFERAAIERWLSNHQTSPMTGLQLESMSLTPAIPLRQLIESSGDLPPISPHHANKS